MRHAEVPRDVLAGVAAFLVADHHHRLTVEGGQAAHDRLVVAEDAVAVQLDPVLHQQVDKVEGVGPLGVACDLGALPGGQAGVDALLLAGQALFQPGDLVARGQGIVRPPQFGDPILQLEEWLLELKLVGHTPRVYFPARADLPLCSPDRAPGSRPAPSRAAPPPARAATRAGTGASGPRARGTRS